ncbi:MAG: CYTH domain-containing protein [Bacteroidales bacterium]
MPKEIERKFLVTGTGYRDQNKSKLYKQGYISIDKERTVRARVAGEKGYITIKGINHGTVRSEYEYEIPADETAKIIEELCLRPIIEKRRYKYTAQDGHIWEIDEFTGENSGLIVAEIELTKESEQFKKPEWIGEEVTDDAKYYNSNLVNNPYIKWHDKNE